MKMGSNILCYENLQVNETQHKDHISVREESMDGNKQYMPQYCTQEQFSLCEAALSVITLA